jgi:hypothetical protein
MTITPMQCRLAIEALAACCAVYATDRPEVIRATGAFCELVRDPFNRQEAEELLKKLAAMAA